MKTITPSLDYDAPQLEIVYLDTLKCTLAGSIEDWKEDPDELN